MSDLGEYLRDVRSMIGRFSTQLDDIGRVYSRKIAFRLVDQTPGYGNQSPEDTLYIPTGRLRGGWNYQSDPGGPTSKGLNAGRTQDGPFSDYGAETIARIYGQIEAGDLRGQAYLVNDIAYAYIIHWGLGRHATPRQWVEEVVNQGNEILAETVREVMG